MLAETRSLQDAYEYAIRRDKGLEHSKAMKTKPSGVPATPNRTLKQESIGYVQPCGRDGNLPNGYQNNQRGRGKLRGRNNFPRGSYNLRGQQHQQMGRNKPCYKCGRKFGPNHLQFCRAKTNSAQNALNEVILQKYTDQ